MRDLTRRFVKYTSAGGGRVCLRYPVFRRCGASFWKLSYRPPAGVGTLARKLQGWSLGCSRRSAGEGDPRMKKAVAVVLGVFALLSVGLAGCHAGADVDPDRAHDTAALHEDRKSTRLNSSHPVNSYA